MLPAAIGREVVGPQGRAAAVQHQAGGAEAEIGRWQGYGVGKVRAQVAGVE